MATNDTSVPTSPLPDIPSHASGIKTGCEGRVQQTFVPSISDRTEFVRTRTTNKCKVLTLNDYYLYTNIVGDKTRTARVTLTHSPPSVSSWWRETWDSGRLTILWVPTVPYKDGFFLHNNCIRSNGILNINLHTVASVFRNVQTRIHILLSCVSF